MRCALRADLKLFRFKGGDSLFRIVVEDFASVALFARHRVGAERLAPW